MELAKNEEINALLEFYRPLLTAKQQEYMQLYYGDDYSLGEIADNFRFLVRRFTTIFGGQSKPFVNMKTSYTFIGSSLPAIGWQTA